MIIDAQCAQSTDAMTRNTRPFNIRTHRPGDMSMIAYRFSSEFGAAPWNFDHNFEVLLNRTVADFLENFHPGRERCWIAEKDGEFMGCIALAQDPDDVHAAKLRLLFTDSKARGLGVCTALVTDCVAFAKEVGYHTITLWTGAKLEGARRLYARAGFELIKAEEQDDWGHKVVGEIWKMTLEES
jgi:GNAT superfamily N-acetyltransferase